MQRLSGLLIRHGVFEALAFELPAQVTFLACLFEQERMFGVTVIWDATENKLRCQPCPAQGEGRQLYTAVQGASETWQAG